MRKSLKRLPIFKNTEVHGITLPSSKSLSNRLLIIRALSGTPVQIENLSDCDDTRRLQEVLATPDGTRFDLGDAGTAMRFLTAFFACRPGIRELYGSPRMHERPIRILVDALRSLGARIEYLGTPGCPPLRIYGTQLTGGEITVSASVSSQYVSALMMIAPTLSQGLAIHLEGAVVSRSYIDMTATLMRDFGGVSVEQEGNTIRIPATPYAVSAAYPVEADWSAASYFFELLAIAPEGNFELTGLSRSSTQGDSRQVKLWKHIGISSEYLPHPERISLSKCHLYKRKKYKEADFTDMPDLIPAFVVACCLTDTHFLFTGLQTLIIKECDRIEALITESARLGYVLTTDEGHSTLAWDGTRCPESEHRIRTYNDHRMAMAFAPAILRYPDLVIENPTVVTKSFPRFWEEFDHAVTYLASSQKNP